MGVKVNTKKKAESETKRGKGLTHAVSVQIYPKRKNINNIFENN